MIESWDHDVSVLYFVIFINQFEVNQYSLTVSFQQIYHILQ